MLKLAPMFLTVSVLTTVFLVQHAVDKNAQLGRLPEGRRSRRVLLDDEYSQIIIKLNALREEVAELKANQVMTTHAPVSFMSYRTSSMAGTQRQPIVYDRVQLNTGNAYNNNHGNFIAPINGTYLFSLYVCSHTAHTIVLDLMKNSVSVGRVLAGDDAFSECTSRSFLVYLTKGDDLFVTEGTYGDLLYINHNYGLPSFIGVLIKAH